MWIKLRRIHIQYRMHWCWHFEYYITGMYRYIMRHNTLCTLEIYFQDIHKFINISYFIFWPKVKRILFDSIDAIWMVVPFILLQKHVENHFFRGDVLGATASKDQQQIFPMYTYIYKCFIIYYFSKCQTCWNILNSIYTISMIVASI